MADQTAFLKLTLPANGEYQDTWDQPINENNQKVDAWAQAVQAEIQDARFGKSSLRLFLTVAHNTDGSLKPTTEMVSSRNSYLYGDEDEEGNDLDVPQRLLKSDLEVFDARAGYDSLYQSLAARALNVSQVISGAKDANGYPAWMGYTGVNVHVDGSATPLWMMINGNLCRVRDLQQVELSGVIQAKYIYATYTKGGVVRVDGDASTAPPAASAGTIGSDGSKVRILQDLTVDFTTKDIQVGDVLTILGTGSNAGVYQIKEIAPSGNVNQLKIYGVFPGGVSSGLNYTVSDPLGVTLGFDDEKVESADKLYLGESDFDGFGATAVRPLHFKDTFVSEWRAVDVSSSASFEEIFNHGLYSDAVDISVQASQADDGSAPIEELSLGSSTNTLGVVVSNNLAVSSGVLSGNITASLSGSLNPDRAVRVQWTKYKVFVKNLIASTFYRDYTGAARQSGFIRVLVKKRV
ncbi:MAG: hypothetical protein EBZ49_00810 [Proteobacteria bacterium]|nr:hypothetical protein [Pseudomonadota bacterium]